MHQLISRLPAHELLPQRGTVLWALSMTTSPMDLSTRYDFSPSACCVRPPDSTSRGAPPLNAVTTERGALGDNDLVRHCGGQS